ncbi:hypothetical protein KM908_14265 [Alkalihalobacillus clausii]|uniref:hypothetical protein n=1 Tax=Shouchella clausii TaxID=79880 RepID=UPI001C2448EE|nr:hypothetical protein [Shouchella clausii]MBU8597306.1 hypothetical protein [Shouchella clausii]
MKTKPLPITHNYAIKSDGIRNFQLCERRVVDPTKSPKWAEKVSKNPGLDPSPYEKWVEIESYHGRLESALHAIVVRETLQFDGDSVTELKAHLDDIHELIAQSMESHDFSAEIARFKVSEG